MDVILVLLFSGYLLQWYEHVFFRAKAKDLFHIHAAYVVPAATRGCGKTAQPRSAVDLDTGTMAQACGSTIKESSAACVVEICLVGAGALEF